MPKLTIEFQATALWQYSISLVLELEASSDRAL